jgi:NMD protein affecting ribosome stability and mRNA decay
MNIDKIIEQVNDIANTKTMEVVRKFYEEREELAKKASISNCHQCGAPLRTLRWVICGGNDRLVSICDAGHTENFGEVSVEISEHVIKIVRRENP